MTRKFLLLPVSMFIVFGIFFGCLSNSSKNQKINSIERHTRVSIEGEKFFINGNPTYAGIFWGEYQIEGLLMNSRMVQGIFDDLNPETSSLWKYPDTNVWSADRNTNEFIDAMESWYSHGMLAFTINLQGGSPTGYGNKGWINSAFDPKGQLIEPYMQRLERILDRADELGMVVILGLFYFGQDEYLENDAAVTNAVDNAMNWLFDKGYTNILIEINNECDILYDHEILQPERVPELIRRVKGMNRNGHSFLVSTSFGGTEIPTNDVIEASDYVLLHGNSVEDPMYIKEMVRLTKERPAYRPMPIVFNEDDHYDFDQPMNNFVAAVQSYASWGYFDFRRDGEPYTEGFQSVPVDWSINSERKRGFFKLMSEITGAENDR